MKGALYIELQKMTRQEEIMRNFSKALWNVLKQYKEKLMVITSLIYSYMGIDIILGWLKFLLPVAPNHANFMDSVKEHFTKK